jgi:hypothetical protein
MLNGPPSSIPDVDTCRSCLQDARADIDVEMLVDGEMAVSEVGELRILLLCLGTAEQVLR